MKKFLLLAVIGFCFSCSRQSAVHSPIVQSIGDSIPFYFNFSTDEEFLLEDRYRAVNRLYSYLRKNERDTIYGHVLYQKNVLHLSLKEYDSLLFYNDKLKDYAIKNGDIFNLARQHYLMGYYFSVIVQDYERAFQNYTTSKSSYEQIKNWNWVGINLLNMGTIQKDFNDYFGSKETLTEALQFLIPENDTIYLAQCYNLLGTNHRKLLNHSDAIKNYNQAISMTGIEIDRLVYHNNLAVTFIDNAQYEDAISILEIISQDPVLKQNQREYARTLDNLAYAQWLSGKEKEVKPFLYALEIRTKHNDKRGQIASYTHLGEIYSKDQPQRAKAHFNTVINLSKGIKMPRAEKDALKFLMQLEPQNVRLRDRYVFLQDSLYEQELKVKTQFANMKYNDEQEKARLLALEKENVEKALQTSRLRNQKIIYLGGFLFTVLVFGLSVYSFRQRTKRLKGKNKTDRLMAIHETESELSRRLHDDHGGKLNQTMLLVQKDADKSVVLDNLEALYNQTRDFSREVNEVDTGSNFKKEFWEMLRFRTPSDAKLFITGSKEIIWEDVAPLTKTVLYKVLQELMINMGKYSKATLITIAFRKTGKLLKVDYADDGVGAPIEALNAKNGLRNTEKRIQALGGTITFDSGKGDGFRANIILPK
nr:hypothetical protein [uncultured Allomuricauda sp.]